MRGGGGHAAVERQSSLFTQRFARRARYYPPPVVITLQTKLNRKHGQETGRNKCYSSVRGRRLNLEPEAF